MIRIFENKNQHCYECWDSNGKMFFYYEKLNDSSICIKRTEFSIDFDTSDSFRKIIGTIIELLLAMNFSITTECPWVKAYLKV
ncbi:hypothetical protein [uncultured Aquimarina sp.]|uniref:hypothetical protein n=1 Tax=uncultured Aquimarina sp. TaxID=575652 RepID=UPI00261275D4|nr:hypothetical protein [uncultured Aquimarina sp.]